MHLEFPFGDCQASLQIVRGTLRSCTDWLRIVYRFEGFNGLCNPSRRKETAGGYYCARDKDHPALFGISPRNTSRKVSHLGSRLIRFHSSATSRRIWRSLFKSRMKSALNSLASKD